jgi:hypothetical protein
MRDTSMPEGCNSTGHSRRTFLRVAGAGGLTTALGAHPGRAASLASDDRAVILLLLVGGPSQLDSFDPKPDAPSEVRGPFRSIATRVPGVRLCEHLPELARRLDRVSLVRSMHHQAAPIHETGLQLVQTGRLFQPGEEQPHFGALASEAFGARSDQAPAFAMLPGPLGSTGVSVSQGQSSGPLGPACQPWIPPAEWITRAWQQEPTTVRAAYGASEFGRACLAARRLVERGSRVVAVNMAQTVFRAMSWDCHGGPPFTTLDDYARVLLPTFDRAFSALIDDLEGRGRLASTLVVATGEFGRTPRINDRGGRDHWPGAWTALVAGGGVRGGQVIGATDRHGIEPATRPVAAADLSTTMAQALGLPDPRRAGPDTPLAVAFPHVIPELFA